MKKTVPLLLPFAAATLLGACASRPVESPTRLYVFDCGNIESRDVSLFSPGVDEGQKKQLTDSCYLIKHAKGTLFWDTGLSDSLTAEGIEVWDGAFHLSVDHPLKAQLDEIGVDPATIDYLGISHFHSDHTGNANYFTQSQLIIQKEEKEAAFGPDAEKFGFVPDSYAKLDPKKMRVIEGDFDVFGDGSVVIKRAVGHTPGHQVLWVNLKQSGPLLLSGDLYHFTKNRTFKRVPAFNFDKEQTLTAMDQIEAFIKESGSTLWIQHDKEQNATIRHSPAFYE
ncbi:MAG: N-acyl homoserine lactonase family protein [Hahellaceae bacterium]|nr:N-acyl homoserine lactonase family protein [Hahellaceae bacterium]MCP5170069.1 N-acyl homoserine lactonase family protein [Hahellaceae bacterium]